MYNHQLDSFVRVADLGKMMKPCIFHLAPLFNRSIYWRIGAVQAVRPFQPWSETDTCGKTLYENTKTLIQLSKDALNKARLLAESSEYTVRIETSLLYKYGLIPEIWTWISDQLPELKIEILPMAEYQNRGNVFRCLELSMICGRVSMGQAVGRASASF